MLMKNIESLLLNTKKMLKMYTDELSHIPRDKDAIEFCSTSCATAFRKHAILSFQLDGDINAFHQNLFSATVCKIFYCCYYLLDLGVEPSIAAITKDAQLFDALACHSDRMAYAFTRYNIIPPDPRYDPNEKLCYSLFVRSLIDPALEKGSYYKDAGVDGWLAAKNGTTRQGLCHALRDAASPEFNLHLADLLQERVDLVDKGGFIPAGEESINVEALGLIRLARKRGIQITTTHAHIPEPLQREHAVTFSCKGLPVLTEKERKDLCVSIKEIFGDKPYPHPYEDPEFLKQ